MAALTVGIGTLATHAADNQPGLVRVAFAPPAQKERSVAHILSSEAEVITLSAPPRDTEEEGRRRFEPVAQYLSKALGKRVVYQHPGNWGVYQGAMQKGAYDIVFDGPHFNGWRVERLQHSILVKAPGDLSQVVFVRKERAITDIKQLAGRTVCAHSPPNLGTLVLQRAFDNPSRQPSIVVVEGFSRIYQALTDGKCQAAVLPLNQLKKFDVDGGMRVVYQSAPLPNQAFSAGPRLMPEDRARLAAALLAPEADAPTAKMRDAYTGGKAFVAATDLEYAGLGDYLKNEWGYH
jgi:ABC-type phosphate/phosphonate transport system substrate-binding protein